MPHSSVASFVAGASASAIQIGRPACPLREQASRTHSTPNPSRQPTHSFPPLTCSGGMYNTKWPGKVIGTNSGPSAPKYDGTIAYAYAKRGQVPLTSLALIVSIFTCLIGWGWVSGAVGRALDEQAPVDQVRHLPSRVDRHARRGGGLRKPEEDPAAATNPLAGKLKVGGHNKLAPRNLGEQGNGVSPLRGWWVGDL